VEVSEVATALAITTPVTFHKREATSTVIKSLIQVGETSLHLTVVIMKNRNTCRRRETLLKGPSIIRDSHLIMAVILRITATTIIAKLTANNLTAMGGINNNSKEMEATTETGSSIGQRKIMKTKSINKLYLP
jgi:hypothetical protein